MSSRKALEDDEKPQEPVDERLKNCDPKLVLAVSLLVMTLLVFHYAVFYAKVEMITSEILDNSPSVRWDDIAGLDFAKQCVMEIVVWPMQK